MNNLVGMQVGESSEGGELELGDGGGEGGEYRAISRRTPNISPCGKGSSKS